VYQPLKRGLRSTFEQLRQLGRVLGERIALELAREIKPRGSIAGLSWCSPSFPRREIACRAMGVINLRACAGGDMEAKVADLDRRRLRAREASRSAGCICRIR
jgi:hypothetical protein